ncbi:MAG: DUF1365 domain-containing protein [Planctomycetota bacterium]|jgi:DUF1365 family protein
MQSAIYEGWVRHRRYAPVRNAFHYRHRMLYLDLAELPQLFERRWLWSVERPNVVWFKRADYLGNRRIPLDRAVRELVEARTGCRPRGPIRLLTQLRTFGYVFNPVSFYYCFTPDGERLEAIVAEITNTPWQERHTYVLTQRENEGPHDRPRFRFPKAFHVSPFMEMDQSYAWRFSTPHGRLRVHMDVIQGGVRLLDATLALERRPLTGRTLARTLLRHPLSTFKVTAAIYLQALRLWWKRCPFVPHPRKRHRQRRGTNDARTHARPRHAPHADRHATPRATTRAAPPGPARRREPVSE